MDVIGRSARTALLLVPLVLSAAACGEDEPANAAAPSSTAASTTTAVSTTSSAPRPVDTAALSGFLEAQLADSGADGGLVALSTGGGPPVIVAAGVTDQASASDVPVDGALPVASITKSYVAAVLLSLQNDGLIDLDDPLGDYVDWPGGDTIALRQLLEHTSGVGPWANATDTTSRFRETVLADLTANYSLTDVVAMLVDIAPLGHPGRQASYSNLNYLLAGRVAEVVAGESFAQILNERIAAPLGLMATYYPVGEAPTLGPAPLPGTFEFDDGVFVSTQEFSNTAYLSLLGPSAAGISTVSDLLTWGDALFRRHRLGSVDLSPMLEIGPGGYGLGVAGVDRAAGTCIFEGCPNDAVFEVFALNGEVSGSSTRLWYDPATDVMAFLYLNRDGSELDAPMFALLDIAAA